VKKAVFPIRRGYLQYVRIPNGFSGNLLMHEKMPVVFAMALNASAQTGYFPHPLYGFPGRGQRRLGREAESGDGRTD